ncbi:putative ammonium transporter 3 [Convolutriloba macropyga]|uniref:putative ammonium transporter 3 n=1 Tax=Convolutriloba macropyga TaxID=536237 RepID=UPI003F523C19
MIGPRTNRWTEPEKFHMDSPINALLGLFMLWWGWLGFNCGSTYGVAGGKWKLASKAAVTTINGSIGGGIVTFIMTFFMQKGKFDVSWIINGILGGLVSITSFCPVMTPSEALVVGGVGGAVVIMVGFLIEYLKIDDPVGAVAVHGGGWSQPVG